MAGHDGMLAKAEEAEHTRIRRLAAGRWLQKPQKCVSAPRSRNLADRITHTLRTVRPRTPGSFPQIPSARPWGPPSRQNAGENSVHDSHGAGRMRSSRAMMQRKVYRPVIMTSVPDENRRSVDLVILHICWQSGLTRHAFLRRSSWPLPSGCQNAE